MEGTLVQMRLQAITLQRLQNLINLTGTTNKTQLISSAIELAEMVVDVISKGGNVKIEKVNGTTTTLKFNKSCLITAQ